MPDSITPVVDGLLRGIPDEEFRHDRSSGQQDHGHDLASLRSDEKGQLILLTNVTYAHVHELEM